MPVDSFIVKAQLEGGFDVPRKLITDGLEKNFAIIGFSELSRLTISWRMFGGDGELGDGDPVSAEMIACLICLSRDLICCMVIGDCCTDLI